MKHARKIFALLLALAMVLCMAACGGKNPNPVESDPPSSGQPDVTMPDVSGMASCSGTVHFGDTFAAVTLYYNTEKWVAECQNAATEFYAVVTGTMDYDVLTLAEDADETAQALFAEMQAMYDEARGVVTVTESVNFGLSAPETTLRYSAEYWHAYFVVEDAAVGIHIDADLAGTIEDGVLVLKKENTDGMAQAMFLPPLQELYANKVGVTFVGTAQLQTGANEVTMWYNSEEWTAETFIKDANEMAYLGGTFNEDGTLKLVTDSSGFGDGMVDAIYQMYLKQKGGTVVGEVDFGMGDPTEVTLTFDATTWTARFYFGLVGEDVTLSGTIEDGSFVLVEDSTGGAGADLMAKIQDALYSSGDSGNGDAVLEVVYGDLSGMSFYSGEIDMNGMATVVATVGYNDTDWVLTYYFTPVSLSVFMRGTIENGQLVLVESSNAYAADTMNLFQLLYEEAVANGSNMQTVRGDVDFNGMATCPTVLHYNDEHFALTYNFTLANKNIIITGDIVDGRLVPVNDFSGAAADVLPGFQALYETR